MPGGLVKFVYSSWVGVMFDLLEPFAKENPSVVQVIGLDVPSKVILVQEIVTVHLAGLMVNAGTVYSSVSPLYVLSVETMLPPVKTPAAGGLKVGGSRQPSMYSI